MWYDVTKRVTNVFLDWRKKLEILLNYFQRLLIWLIQDFCCCKSRKLNFEKKKWKLNFSLKKYGSQFCDAHNFSRCFNFEGMKWTDATVHKFGDFIKTRNRKKKLFQPRIECMNMISLEHLCFQCTTWDIWYFAFHSHRH